MKAGLQVIMSSGETASPFQFHQKNNQILLPRNEEIINEQEFVSVTLVQEHTITATQNTHKEADAVQQLTFCTSSELMNLWCQNTSHTCSSFSYRKRFQKVVSLWAKFEYGSQTVRVATIWCTQ